MRCPICDQNSSLPFTVKEARTLLICEDCRHIWFAQTPTERELLDYYAADYTSVHLQEDLQESQAAYYRSHAKELRDLADGPIAIADVGCSIPVFLREAAEESSRRIGVDLSSEAHELGRQWGIEMTTPEDFLQDIPDESLDVLRYSHVLEHLPDPLGTIETQVAKVKRGGIVYITQPNFPVLRAEPTTVDLHDSVWPSHLHFFNPLSAIAMLERVGLQLVRFFTLCQERKAMSDYGRFMDLLTAADRLDVIKDVSEEYGMFTGWPFYAGVNVGCFARKQ